MEETEWQKFSE